jgi:hypothetical protein
LLGKFSFCLNEEDLAQQLKSLAAAKKISSIYCNEEQIKSELAKRDLAS